MSTRVKSTKSGSGRGTKARPKTGNGEAIHQQVKRLEIPPLEYEAIKMKLAGTSPLMLNNKMGVAPMIAKKYDEGRASNIKLDKLPLDEQYALAFYVMPSSKHPAPHAKGCYGVPASGIKKCLCKGCRPAGMNNNTDIGTIHKAFHVMADEGGLCEIHHDGFTRDIRPVNIGSGQKTVPSMRHRPMFFDWWINLNVYYNPRVITQEALVNLGMYAGAYIGLCELRAEKLQGECGGFTIK